MQTPYFHGTDFRILRLSCDERSLYKADCQAVTDYLWPIFAPYWPAGVSKLKDALDGAGQHLAANLLTALTLYTGEKKGNEQFQYEEGCIYVTSSSMKAESYAMSAFAGGEVGLRAYRMIQAATMLCPDALCAEAAMADRISRIKAMAEAPNEPCVIWLMDLDSRYLESDTGIPYDASRAILFQNARYRQQLTLKPEDAKPLADFREFVRQAAAHGVVFQ